MIVVCPSSGENVPDQHGTAHRRLEFPEPRLWTVQVTCPVTLQTRSWPRILEGASSAGGMSNAIREAGKSSVMYKILIAKRVMKLT